MGRLKGSLATPEEKGEPFKVKLAAAWAAVAVTVVDSIPLGTWMEYTVSPGRKAVSRDPAERTSPASSASLDAGSR
jgi:hypothetical protein